MQFHPSNISLHAFHAPPGEEAALAVMRKNIAVMYFAEGQLQSAGEVLERKLGKERQVSLPSWGTCCGLQRISRR